MSMLSRITVVSFCIALAGGGRVAVAADAEPTEPLVTIETLDTPLVEALARFDSEREIRVELKSTLWAHFPVSVQARNVPLAVALRDMLRGVNHYTVFDGDRGYELYVLGRAPAHGAAAGSAEPARAGASRIVEPGEETVPEETASLEDLAPWALPGFEVLPPSEPGGKGVSPLEVDWEVSKEGLDEAMRNQFPPE